MSSKSHLIGKQLFSNNVRMENIIEHIVGPLENKETKNIYI